MSRFQLPVQIEHWFMFLQIGISAVVLFIIDESVHQLLNYHSLLISGGEYWRMISGHLLHTNFYHLCLNLGGLFLLWALHGEYYRPATLFCMFMSIAASISVTMLLFSEITLYVGLSGVIHGLFVWGVIQDIKYKDPTGWLLLVAIIAKIAHEQIAGGDTHTAMLIEANVAFDAHLYGAFAGLLCVLLFKPCSRSKKAPEGA